MVGYSTQIHTLCSGSSRKDNIRCIQRCHGNSCLSGKKAQHSGGGAGRHEGQLLEKEGQDQTLVDLCDKLNLWDATHNTREGH